MIDGLNSYLKQTRLVSCSLRCRELYRSHLGFLREMRSRHLAIMECIAMRVGVGIKGSGRSSGDRARATSTYARAMSMKDNSKEVFEMDTAS